MAKNRPVKNSPKCTSIDPINYREVVIDTLNGPQLLKGITVRALRKALETADQDALVTYMAEQNKEQIAANQRAYYEQNKEQIAANQRARWRSRAEADPSWARQQLQPLYNWLATRCIGTISINSETERYLPDITAVDPEEKLLAECDRQSTLDTIRDMLPDETFDILMALAENDMDVEATSEELSLPPSVIIESLALARAAAETNEVIAA